ncbi:TetR/AcrR family transcriptional regulator [Streptomyces iconiensis]|uniref:TetR/AcrR family transcriptional regulator n=1 Tax=Streptomyces iconiensis TaxID=1384038 RepID=A0ABT6ZR88_9ACTN|nr:TetR/AcrR family transcriptional regulator [Streptomyces iconiensis]MDJ1131549.1 TetR/AcrR family transcriptional regulator [Streptomyces iconiensis]
MPRTRRGRPGPLPLLDAEPAERADAARNRRKILAATRGLIARRPLERISLDEVAEAAGVGVGTVYRRFGDRSGLAYALLDESERALQESFLRGGPPLGPGAPPAERILAFLHAYLHRLLGELDLMLAAETAAPNGRHTGAYSTHRAHLATLLAELRPEGDDPGWLADALLAPLAAPLVRHQTRELGMTEAQIGAGLGLLVQALTAGSCAGAPRGQAAGDMPPEP